MRQIHFFQLFFFFIFQYFFTIARLLCLLCPRWVRLQTYSRSRAGAAFSRALTLPLSTTIHTFGKKKQIGNFFLANKNHLKLLLLSFSHTIISTNISWKVVFPSPFTNFVKSFLPGKVLTSVIICLSNNCNSCFWHILSISKS